jgi:hypothetical protein
VVLGHNLRHFGVLFVKDDRNRRQWIGPQQAIGALAMTSGTLLMIYSQSLLVTGSILLAVGAVLYFFSKNTRRFLRGSLTFRKEILLQLIMLPFLIVAIAACYFLPEKYSFGRWVGLVIVCLGAGVSIWVVVWRRASKGGDSEGMKK